MYSKLKKRDICKVSKVCNEDEDVWSYREESRQKEAVIAVGVIIALSIMLILLNQDISTVLPQFLALIFLVSVVLALAAATTTIEINRNEATVKKIHKIFFFRRNKTYPLHDFQTVKLIRKTKAVEEGNVIIVCSLMLERENCSVEILSTEDENRGKFLHREIAAFLKLTAG